MLLLAATAPAQLTRTIDRREVPPDAQTNCFELVPAPAATWCVVSETAQVAVVGHAPGTDRHFTVVPLDAAGRVLTNTPPAAVVLPRPASLAAVSNVAVTAAAHPSLPLLYVLQDVANTNSLPLGDPATNPVFRDLDRLLVFRLSATGAELVTAVRGDWIRYGLWGDGYPLALAVDPAAGRLYLPCVRARYPEPGIRAIGYIALDDQGLPVARDGVVLPAATLPVDLVTATPGYGWMILSSNRVACGAGGAILFWDQADRAGRCQSLAPAPYHPLVIAGHPNGLLLYAVYIQQTIYAVELADGRPTLQPRGLSVTGRSLPVVMAARRRVALGASGRVSLLATEADGQLTGEDAPVPVPGFAGSALYYSMRFDRLYVAVAPTP